MRPLLLLPLPLLGGCLLLASKPFIYDDIERSGMPDGGFEAIVASTNHACAIHEWGGVFCLDWVKGKWKGRDGYYQWIDSVGEDFCAVDEDGTVGRAYGAVTTPHLYVIDGEGVLRYEGAVDNHPMREKSGDHKPYAAMAIDDLLAGRAVGVPRTRPYGCSVKYGG